MSAEKNEKTIGQFRVTQEDYELLDQAANTKRLNVTAYVRQAALMSAERDIKMSNEEGKESNEDV